MVAPPAHTRKAVRSTPGSAALRILAVGTVIGLLYVGRVFFVTAIFAAMIAMLLDPLVRLFMKLRLPRGVASFAVCSLALAILYVVGVGVYTESIVMIDDLPAYSDRINQLIDSAAARAERVEQGVYHTLVPKRFQDPEPEAPSAAAAKGKRKPSLTPSLAPAAAPQVQEVRIHPEPTTIFSNFSEYLGSFYNVLLMASFVPFLVYFLLSWSDHLRSRFLYLFEGEDRNSAERAWTGVGKMVRAYVIGNFMLGVILSIASSLLFASVKLPYWLVVGPISGFLSLVPYIGLPLAMLPPMIAALPAGTAPALYLFIGASVALLHLFALNLLYPKFVGARVHLNPLVVTVALMFWGMLWGGIGLLLAIPLTAALKAVCDNVATLRPYGRLLGD
jgi:predicted PurR-regulated permease PerM